MPKLFVYLFDTSLDLTRGPLLVVGEAAAFEVILTNVVGPQSDLVVLVESENPGLIEITDVNVFHVGSVECL